MKNLKCLIASIFLLSTYSVSYGYTPLTCDCNAAPNPWAGGAVVCSCPQNGALVGTTSSGGMDWLETYEWDISCTGKDLDNNPLKMTHVSTNVPSGWCLVGGNQFEYGSVTCTLWDDPISSHGDIITINSVACEPYSNN